MFKKSDKNIQGDLFSGIPSILGENPLKQYNDINGWHNQFHKQISLRIDKSVFNSMDNEEYKFLNKKKNNDATSYRRIT